MSMSVVTAFLLNGILTVIDLSTNKQVLGRSNHLLSFHFILSVWYYTDLIENTVCLLSRCLATAF
jgi:hypothetical protein